MVAALPAWGTAALRWDAYPPAQAVRLAVSLQLHVGGSFPSEEGTGFYFTLSRFSREEASF